MVTTAEELLGAFTAAQAGVNEARARTEEAISLTRALTEEAAAHGWEGVAATMGSVDSALGAVLGGLGSFDGDGAGALLHGIAGDVSRRDVLERLESSVPELEKGTTALEGAATGTDEALAGATQAGEPASLMTVLHALRETLTGALGQLSDVRQKAENEVATAGGWGN